MSSSSLLPHLWRDLVIYLDDSGQLDIISASIKNLSTTVAPLETSSNSSFNSVTSAAAARARVFEFRPNINVTRMIDISPQLGVMVQTDPVGFRKLLQCVIFQQAKCLESEEIASKSQLVVTPVVVGLGPFYEHLIKSSGWLVGLSHGEHLRSMKVTLVALSEKMKYVSSTSYTCPSMVCQGGMKEMYVKVFSPLSGNQRCQECFNCGEQLQEQFNKRDISEVVTGLVVEMEETQVMEAIFREEESNMLVVGGQFLIVFTVVHMRANKLQATRLLEVVSVEPTFSGPGRLLHLTEDVHLSPVLHQLFKDRMESPWSFVLSLAYLLGGNVTPRGTFFKLKLGLLLSLVGGQEGDKGNQCLHLLAAGVDSTFTPRLMRECLSLSPRSGIYTSNSTLVGNISKRQVNYLEAGQLHLTREGVLYLGDLSLLKQPVREELRRVVESGYVTGPPLPTSPPLRYFVTTSLWSYVSLSSIKYKAGTGKAQLLDNIKDVVDMFDIVIVTDSDDVEIEDKLCSHSLQLDQLLSPGPLQPVQLAEFLEQVKHRQVSVKKESLLLLKRYFLSSRRVRQVSQTGPEFPQSALSTLIKLATSHAKLSLRSEVTLDDAVFACHMYEETVTSRSGYSYLGVVPSPSIVSGSLNKVLGRENDLNMREFHIKLEKFIHEYSLEEVEGGVQQGDPREERTCGRGERKYWCGGRVDDRLNVDLHDGVNCEE